MQSFEAFLGSPLTTIALAVGVGVLGPKLVGADWAMGLVAVLLGWSAFRTPWFAQQNIGPRILMACVAGGLLGLVGFGLNGWRPFARVVALAEPSKEFAESFAYLTPQPYDQDGRIRFSVRSVGRDGFTDVRVKIYDLEMLGDGSPQRELEIGPLPNDQLVPVDNFFVQPFPHSRAMHVYRFELITDRDIFDQTMVFRLSGDQRHIEDMLRVEKHQKLSEPMVFVKPLYTQDWHSWEPKKEPKP